MLEGIDPKIDVRRQEFSQLLCLGNVLPQSDHADAITHAQDVKHTALVQKGIAFHELRMVGTP